MVIFQTNVKIYDDYVYIYGSIKLANFTLITETAYYDIIPTSLIFQHAISMETIFY